MGIKNFIKFKGTLMLFLLSVIILNMYLFFSISKSNNAKEDIVRFHVVANSNSILDQITKLKISSKLEEYISNLNLENKNVTQVLNELKDNSDKIIEISDEVLEEENLKYGSEIKIGKINYAESKDTQLLHMDSGSYNSIQVLLGEAKGTNFWSLISPSKENLEKLQSFNTILPGILNLYKNFQNENNFDEDLVSNNNNNTITYKSKILELFNIN